MPRYILNPDKDYPLIYGTKNAHHIIVLLYLELFALFGEHGVPEHLLVNISKDCGVNENEGNDRYFKYARDKCQYFTKLGSV